MQKKLAELRCNSDAPKNFGHPLAKKEPETNQVDIYLYDVIGWPWITAMDIVSEVPKNTQTINVHINSPGGEVFEGLAIYDFFREHSARINIRVTGLAASMASVIAMAGDAVTIPKSSYFMIHKPWVWMLGTDEDLEKEAGLLRKIGRSMAEIYAEFSGKEVEQIEAWMKSTTYFNGAEAVAHGFANEETDSDLLQGSGSSKAPVYNLAAYAHTTPDRTENSQLKRVAMALPNNTDHTTNKEKNHMNEKLRAVLEAKGLAADATDEQALEFLSTMNHQGDPVDHEALQAEAVKAEQARQKEIRKMCHIAELDGTFTESLIDSGIRPEDASRKIFEEMARVNPPFGAGRFESGKTEGEKFHEAARDGLLIRSGIKVEKPAPGAETFRGYELTSIIRESLSRAGVNVSGLNSRRAVADFVFRSRQGSMTTSDFPAIFRDALNKSLLKSYMEAPATWRPWVNITTASDFKDIYGVALSEAPDLKEIKQGAEYTFGALKDNQESYRLAKFGRLLQVTWEMLINDDLRAFNRYPQQMGNAARRLESDIVYGLLVSGNNNHGPTMTDTYQLFKATDHNNLLQTGRSITADNIDAAMQLMGAQTGLNGSLLDIQPRFIIVGPKNRLAAMILFASASSVDSNKNAGVINPLQGELEVIVENRVGQKFSGLGWYIIGDPSQHDTIEVAFLDGYEQPTIDEQEEFTRDALIWKVRHCIGAGVMDYRAMVLNDGTA